MINNKENKLDPKVVTVTLIIGVLEFELFMQPKSLVAIAQQDVWLSILLGSIFSTIGTIMLVCLASRFPREHFFSYTGRIVGKPISYLIAIGYILFWMIYLIMLFKDTNIANKLLFLPETPSIVPMLIFTISAAWLVSYGITAITRFFQLMLPVFIIPLIPIYLMSFRRVDWDNFLPILSNGFLPVIKGAVYYAGVLQGLELLLFISPFLINVNKALKPALIGINLINLIALLQVVLTIGVMGIDNIKFSVWPGINTMSLIELPGFPVERFELFFTFPWITAVFTTIILMIYLVSYGMIQLFKIKHRMITIYIVSICGILGTYLIPNYIWQLKLRDNFYIPTLVFVYGLPLIIFIMSILRGKRSSL